MRPEESVWMRRRISGIELRDWPTMIRMRLTHCRREGHSFAMYAHFCENCGAPWLVAVWAKEWRDDE